MLKKSSRFCLKWQENFQKGTGNSVEWIWEDFGDVLESFGRYWNFLEGSQSFIEESVLILFVKCFKQASKLELCRRFLKCVWKFFFFWQSESFSLICESISLPNQTRNWWCNNNSKHLKQDVSGVCKGCSKGVLKMFWILLGRFKGVSRIFQRCFKCV